MSSGGFKRTFYELNNGEIINIRVQPETEDFTNGTVANEAPAGPATIPGTAKVSKGRREYGIGPRKVSFKFNEGAAPDGYSDNQLYYIPVLSRDAFDAYIPGTGYTYLEGAGEVITQIEESVK